MKRAAVLGVFLSIAIASTAIGDLYVANTGGASVTIYAPSATPGGAPSRTIAGAATNFVDPSDVFVDQVNNELIVSDFQGQAIRVYSLAANGNAAPIRTLINGPNSGLGQPRRAIVDTAHNELIVTLGNNSIRTYPRTANGDVAPTRVISGGATLLSNPLALDFDVANDELITTTFNTGGGLGGILVFPRLANGNVAPTRVIGGSNTSFPNQAPEVAFDPVSAEYVARINAIGSSGLAIFPRLANGNVAPSRLIQGSLTGLFGLGGVAVDNVTSRYITSGYISSNTVRFFDKSANGNTAPLLVIGGALTGLSGPFGVAVDAVGGPTTTGAPPDLPALGTFGLAALIALLAIAGSLTLRR